MSAKDRAKRAGKSLSGFVIALAVVIAIIGGLYLYSGIWPPLVVVESNSMQHSDDRSFIGVIDTGDLVILKKIGSYSEIRPYLESYPSGYSTYGELGDVVIYRPYGSYDRTPIIHRALCKVLYNSSGGGFDVPALREFPDSMWEVRGGPQSWYNIKATLVLSDVGFDHVPVRINFTTMLANFSNQHVAPHGGLITLGDNNQGTIDQSSVFGICWRPVQEDWVNGVARGELPWFGLIKLYANGQADDVPVPSNSITNLWVSLALLIGVPIAIDVVTIYYESKGVDIWAKVRKALRLPPKKPKEEAPPEVKKKAPDKDQPAKKGQGPGGKGGAGKKGKN